MYVCLCHGVTESAIRLAVNEGVRSFAELSFRTGCGTQCGSCASRARALLGECLEPVAAAKAARPKLVGSSV